MARRKKDDEVTEGTEVLGPPTPVAEVAEVIESSPDQPAQQENPQNDLERDLFKVRGMLDKAKKEQQRMRDAQNIVFERGITADQKEEKLVEQLGYSYSQAADIMMQKDDTDQFENPVVRPGFTREQRMRAGANVANLQRTVNKLENKLGVQHTSQVEEGRENNEPDQQAQIG